MKRLLHMGALGGLLAAASLAPAELLTNGDFESMPNWGMGVLGDSGYTALTGSQIPGWTIEAGHAATVHNTNLYPTISGTYSINMDGEGYNGVNANLYQDFMVGNGDAGTLDFDWLTWANNNADKLDVTITDLVTNSVLVHGSYSTDAGGVHHESFNFVGTGNALRLRVKEDPESHFNDNSFMVDNFSVNAVPEPASVLALAGGTLVLLRRRKRA
ncbi:MAG: DUF642 domain-containing protein [Armatimonadetes bacterium]|nr:DUF642 domain-containing protein [Armatimonadota bacterium]